MLGEISCLFYQLEFILGGLSALVKLSHGNKHCTRPLIMARYSQLSINQVTAVEKTNSEQSIVLMKITCLKKHPLLYNNLALRFLLIYLHWDNFRLFWVLVLIFSIYTCATLIMNIWDKWNNNPVIVSFAEKSTPVWQIPFPTVTVCTETKGRQTAFNFTEMYWKISDRFNNVTDIDLTDEE